MSDARVDQRVDARMDQRQYLDTLQSLGMAWEGYTFSAPEELAEALIGTPTTEEK